ncbi:U-box domain-containing protein 20-like [Phragmites australis]|uniref:U-box domain-containing protein 20-like n=1 Tax=Phragmites australis TaxID=29695 RepID=UPI002D79D629|nr:U-box domain-containing protein 20-like [Phragmites australis]
MATPMSRPRPRAARVAVSEIPLATRRARLQPPVRPADAGPGAEPAVPSHFLCPISLDLMRDPVTAPTGITYDRDSVEGWLERGHAMCPVTARPLRVEELIPNHATRRMIQEWCVANRGLGVERVPTPRVPVSAAEASELLAAVSAAARRGDGLACQQPAARARALAKESERNRRCFSAAGAARALSSAFSHLVEQPAGTALTTSGALEEILTSLVVFFPLDEESRRCIASPASLNAVVSILSHGEVAARVSAAVVLREIASSSDSQCLDAMSKTNGVYDALIRLLEKPMSPQATKAALVTAYYLVTNTYRAASRLVDLGMVQLLVELLVDSDKGMTEKTLAVLDSLFLTEEGRDKAYAHALAVPVLVKKMQHVSDMATEFAVSALWRLCKNFSDEGRCKAEALQVGAFQKLLLLLQVGCMGATKERASELLRLLNGSRGSVECIETVDFKGLKRPF